MPLPMNSTAKRRGEAAAPPASDSRQGRATRTPRPRSTALRESSPLRERILKPPGEELPAGHDGLDEVREPVGVAEPGPHLIDGGVVRGDEGAPQGVAEQLAAEVVEELVLPVGAQI